MERVIRFALYTGARRQIRQKELWGRNDPALIFETIPCKGRGSSGDRFESAPAGAIPGTKPNSNSDELLGGMSMRLECHGLNFTYPGSETRVIEDLRFSMAGPGFHAVFGPSGVGKTSFARLLAQYRDHPDLPLQTPGIDTILYTYNLERLPGWSAAGRHLDRICPQNRRDLKKELIDIFRMGPLLDARFSQLSMGQQNRMNLIRYLLQDFDMMILDESLANVDEKLRQTILVSVKALFSQKMFLYISHNLMEVARFCKHILVMTQPSRQRPGRVISGLDDTTGADLEKAALDRVMLEVMNAV
jgi:ABC-type nitrate/sulfonate/bicarbonate transport system ATPase subunit